MIGNAVNGIARAKCPLAVTPPHISVWVEMMNNGEALPVDLNNRFIYYVGPVDPVRDEVVGPAGPDHCDMDG